VFSAAGHLGIVMDYHDSGNLAQYMAHRKVLGYQFQLVSDIRLDAAR
jgi:hypothetical protein